MTDGNFDHTMILGEVERKLPALLSYSEDELLAEVAQLTPESHLLEVGVQVDYEDLVVAGHMFMLHGPFHATICDPANKNLLKDILGTTINAESAAIVVSQLLPILGISAVVVIPTGLIALALVLMKFGVDKYCRQQVDGSKEGTQG